MTFIQPAGRMLSKLEKGEPGNYELRDLQRNNRLIDLREAVPV